MIGKPNNLSEIKQGLKEISEGKVIWYKQVFDKASSITRDTVLPPGLLPPVKLKRVSQKEARKLRGLPNAAK